MVAIPASATMACGRVQSESAQKRANRAIVLSRIQVCRVVTVGTAAPRDPNVCVDKLEHANGSLPSARRRRRLGKPVRAMPSVCRLGVVGHFAPANRKQALARHYPSMPAIVAIEALPPVDATTVSVHGRTRMH